MSHYCCRSCHRPGVEVQDGRGTRTVLIHAVPVGHPFEVMEVGR